MKSILSFAFILALFFISSCSGSKKTSKAGAPTSNVSTKKIDYAMLDANTFALNAITVDDSYGYTAANPIKVGGAKERVGPTNERRFLNALLGPNGEEVTYERQGSCCAFKTPNGLLDNTGMLDRYEVKYNGLDKPVILFVNMYDYGELKAPKGFTYRK